MEREGNEYFSLFFHILFFPWAKMGLDPPPKLEFSHAQDGRLKTTFSIPDNADSWVTVSRDLVEYSGSGILFGAHVITATDRKTLRNLIRTTEFSTNWVIKTQLAQL